MATLKRKDLGEAGFHSMDLSTGHAKSKKEDSDELSGTVVAEEASAKRVRTAEDGPGEDEDADEDLLEEVVETGEGGGKKEKAVKVKKIFLPMQCSLILVNYFYKRETQEHWNQKNC